MADRVPASIALGGGITAAQLAELTKLIHDEGLSTEWDGEPFDPAQLTASEPLRLYAHEVAWGMFEELEAWCREHRVPYMRWSGGFGSEWGAERTVFAGAGEPVSYDADENDRIVVHRQTVERLGSVEAVLAHFDAADFVLPPLFVEDQPVEP